MSANHISTFDGARPAFAGAVLAVTALLQPCAGENTASPLTPFQFGGLLASVEGNGYIPAITPRGSTFTAGEFLTEGPLSAEELEAITHAAKVPNVGRAVDKEFDPKLRDFVKRVFVPALVKRYISGLKRDRLLVNVAANA